MTGVRMIENQPLRHGHNGSGIGGLQCTNNFGAKLLVRRQNQNAGAAFRRKLKDCVTLFTMETCCRPAEVDSAGHHSVFL